METLALVSLVGTAWMMCLDLEYLGSRTTIDAKARGEYLRTHFQNMREVAAALTGMKLSKAYTYLAAVLEHDQVIPFPHYIVLVSLCQSLDLPSFVVYISTHWHTHIYSPYVMGHESQLFIANKLVKQGA